MTALYFNTRSNPCLVIHLPQPEAIGISEIKYDGHVFSVIKNRISYAIPEANLSSGLKGMTLDKIANCNRDLILRLGRNPKGYTLQLEHVNLTAKAFPYSIGMGVASPVLGAITGVFLASNPAGWCVGALIGGSVGIGAIIGTIATTAVIDHRNPNKEAHI